MGVTDLDLTKTLAARVDAYGAAVEKIKQAYAILEEAQALLRDAFQDRYGFDVIPDRYGSSPLDVCKKALDKIRRSAWRRLIDLSQVRKVMSVRRAEDLDTRLDKGEMEEITHGSVLGMLSLLRDQSGEFALEAVKEVYGFLRPGAYQWAKPYKTNGGAARWRLGKKVILVNYAIDGYGSSLMRIPSGECDRRLRALDRVFHLLDGKGVPEGYYCPLIDAINTSLDGFGQTEYFSFRACRNGNLHIEFTRPDLVVQFNQLAGGGNILHD